MTPMVLRLEMPITTQTAMTPKPPIAIKRIPTIQAPITIMAHQLQQRQTMRKSIFFLLFSFPISSTTTTSATKFVVGYVFIFQTTKLLQIIILRLLQRENFKQIKKNYKNKPMMLT